MTTGTWAWTKYSYIYVPDVEYVTATLPTGAELKDLRGYAYTKAVIVDGNCVGWIGVS